MQRHMGRHYRAAPYGPSLSGRVAGSTKQQKSRFCESRRRRRHRWPGIAEFAGLEIAGLEFDGLEIYGLEFEGLERTAN